MKALKLEELLDSFLSRGDTSAMEEFVRRTQPRLLRVARRIGAAQDAEDSVQAAYHSLLARGAAPIDAPCEAWLVTAVVRIAYRRKAAAKRQHELAQRLDRPRSSPTPFLRLTREETQRLVRRAVTALPDKYRDAIVLHHLEGLSTAEIAQLLDVARSTVTTRLHRGRRLLRRRLPLHLVYSVLVVPWLIQDMAGAGTTAASGIGVIMKTKTVATVIVVGLAAGATGYGAATLGAASSSGPPTRAGRREVHDLEIKLARAHEEVRELQRMVDGQPAARATGEVATKVSAPKRQTVTNRPRIWEAAQRLKVSSEALAAAIRAEKAVATNAADRYDLLRELKAFGEDGFRAALAIVRGSYNSGQPQQKLLDETYMAGLEGLLLETLDSREASWNVRSVAIRTLAKADTPAVREYLVQRIEHEENPGLFYCLTMTLGSLREPRAAVAVGRKLLFDDPVKEADWKLLRLGMLHQLSEMGGEDAHRILRDYLRDERVTRGENIAQALNSLAQLDKPLCGELAHEILQEPRGKALSEQHAQRVRHFLVYRPQ